VASFSPMAYPTMNCTRQHRVVLPVLLLAVIATGLPRVEIHTHHDAYHGHVHYTHDHDDPDSGNSGNLDEPGNIGVIHTHDVDTSTLTLVSACNVDIVAHRQADGEILPPVTKPPDSVIAPLYRPPIV